ncbi:MAG: succinate dehydrogenase assembly factor 2 [Pseudomonadota bacterium]
MDRSLNSPDASKLRWRCRRGTKELDMLTSIYLDHHYEQATLEEQCAFASLLELQDPQLYKILTKEEVPKDILIQSIVNKIHAQ